MKKFIVLLLVALMLIATASCGGTGEVVNSGSNSTNDSTIDSGITDTQGGGKLPDDDTPKPGPSTDNAEINLNVPKVEDVLKEELNVFESEDTFGNEGSKGIYTSYDGEINLGTAQTQYKITNSGTYKVYGKSKNSQIYIKASGKKVTLVLAGVEITNLSSAPVIYAEECSEVTIMIAKDTVNTLVDNEKNGENGVIRVRSCNLTLDGQGTLNIIANAKHGISNTKQLTIKGGTYNISAPGHGIYGKEKLTIDGGKFNITSQKGGFKTGDDEVDKEKEGALIFNKGSATITCETNGLNAYGTIEINDGRINVKANSRGIYASKNITISGGTIILNTKKDTIKTEENISVSGNTNIFIDTRANGIEGKIVDISINGVLYIETTPIYMEDDLNDDIEPEYKLVDNKYVVLDGTEDSSVKKYYVIECKGIEAKENVNISSGTIGISSFEDCINATKDVTVSGGKLVLSSTKDGIDASNTVAVENADIYVVWANKGIKGAVSVELNSGKTLILTSSDAINSAIATINGGVHYVFEKIDCTGELKIDGGTVISLSTTKAPVKANATIKCVSDVLILNDTAGQWIRVRSGALEAVIKLPKDYSEKCCILVADEQLDTEVTVEIGTNEGEYENVNDYVYTNGTFTAEQTQRITVE